MASIRSLLPAALLHLLVVGFAPHGAEAAGSGSAPVAVLAGVVPCSTGTSINVAAAAVFPHAGVQMVCGSKVVAGVTADSSGAFLINLGPVNTTILTSLLGNECKLVVITPLAACNVSLADATGTLTAPLQLVGAGGGNLGSGGLGGLIGLIVQIIGGLLGGILNIVPLPFSLV